MRAEFKNCRKDDQARYETLLSKQQSSKKFFKYLKSRFEEKTSLGDVEWKNQLANTDMDKANLLNEYFSSVYEPAPCAAPPLIGETELTDIAEETISLALSSLNPDSAPGPDGIPLRFWLNLSDSLCPVLSRLFTKLLNEHYVPRDWLKSNVFPLYKGKGPIEKCENYRPISLICTIAKVFEKCLEIHLSRDLDGLLSDHQHGFRAKHSTVGNLLETYDFISSLIDTGQSADIIFLDFRKAFDKVSHEILLKKLATFKIKLVYIKWLREYLCKRVQTVVVNGILSTPLSVSSGVPQGSILSPLLFSLFLNDLLTMPIKNRIRAYADDSKLLGSVDTDESLIPDLERIVKWTEGNKLPLNIEKCIVMHFGKNNPMHIYKINGTPLPSSLCERDLGVLVDNNLSFDNHIANTVRKSFGVINMMFRSIESRDPNLLVRLYKIYVLPIIEYGLPLSSPRFNKHNLKLERIQKFFTRKLFPELSYKERLIRTGLRSLEDRRNICDMVTTFKILRRELACSIPFEFLSLRNMHTTRGHELRLVRPPFHLDSRKYFFSVRSIPHWNALPFESMFLENSREFKSFMYRWTSTSTRSN